MSRFERKISGFTLLEMILVLVIISSLMVMFLSYTVRKGEQLRLDKTVLNAQQVLNAGLAYYVDHGKWSSCGTAGCWIVPSNPYYPLMDEGYLSKSASFKSFWGDMYYLQSFPNSKNFSVCILVYPGPSAVAIAETIASRLPMGRTEQNPINMTQCAGREEQTPIENVIPCDGTNICYVIATVNVPGQNLNNARSLNFAGVYYNGACVPTPVCPGGTKMEPQIIVTPSSVSGLYNGTGAPGTPADVFPINSFTAFAKGPTDWDPQNASATGPARCTSDDPNDHAVCQWIDDSNPSNPQTKDLPKGKYWRVCLDIVTALGKISTSSNGNWVKESGSITAATRCVPPNEPAGGTEIFRPE